jgi:hypothetical protein
VSLPLIIFGALFLLNALACALAFIRLGNIASIAWAGPTDCVLGALFLWSGVRLRRPK